MTLQQAEQFYNKGYMSKSEYEEAVWNILLSKFDYKFVGDKILPVLKEGKILDLFNMLKDAFSQGVTI